MSKDEEIFFALINEAHFTCQMLGAGVTQIRQADYSKKGMYFQAFTNLSTGFERMGKLCFIVNYANKNNGSMPEATYLKNKLRHDLNQIHAECIKIKVENKYKFKFKDNLEEPIYLKILTVLSKFAKGDRYSNIDFITNSRKYPDPIVHWHCEVDLFLYENMVSESKKTKIEQNAKIINYILEDFTSVYHQSDSGNTITTIFEGSKITGEQNLVSHYRQIYILDIIRYYVELLDNIEHESRQQRFGMIPFFLEIFGRFYNDNKYLKGHKNWDKTL